MSWSAKRRIQAVLVCAASMLAVTVSIAGESSRQLEAAGGGSDPKEVGSRAVPFEQQVLWQDEDHRDALFLPTAVTADADVAKLPLEPSERRFLEYEIRVFKNSKDSSCRRKDPPEPGSAGGKTIDQLISGADVSFLGTVVATVQGWTPWPSEVTTATYIRVDEIVHGDGVPHGPKVGDVVAIKYFGGKTVVAGTPLCADPIENFPVPAQGDRLLVAGQPWLPDTRFFYDFARFPVVADEVRPEPRADLVKGTEPVRVDRLVKEVRTEIRERWP